EAGHQSRGEWSLWLAPLRPPHFVQIQSRCDQGDMRECLRKVSDLPLRVRVVLLREEPNIVPQRQQALEQGTRLPVAVLQRIVVGEPKTAGEERAFPRGQSVEVYAGAITPHQAINHELSLDRRDGAAHARIV